MNRWITVFEGVVLALATLPAARLVADRSLRRSTRRAWLVVLGALVLWLTLILILAVLSPLGLAVLAAGAGLVLVAASVRAHPVSRRVPPGSLSLVSSVKALANRRFYLARSRRHGPIFKMAQYRHRVVCVLGLERGHRLLREHASSLASSPQPFTSQIAGGFLRYMDEATHKTYAPLFRRALARPVVASGEAVTAASAARELERLADACAALDAGVAPAPYLDMLVENAFLHVLYGLERGHDECYAFLDQYRTLEAHPLGAPLTDAGLSAVRALRDVLRAHHARLASSDPMTVCTLTELGRAAPGMPDHVCLDNLVFVHKLSAGNVVALLCWLLFELGRSPDWMARLREEADAAESSDALADRTVMETLRLNQSEYLFRTVAREFEFEGFRFPAGWQVRHCVWESHRDPAVFVDPESFEPDRYLACPVTSAEYSPFGWGSHACNGVALTEMICRTFLRELIGGFEVEVSGGEPFEHGHRHWNHWRPGSNLRLRLVRRAGRAKSADVVAAGRVWFGGPVVGSS